MGNTDGGALGSTTAPIRQELLATQLTRGLEALDQRLRSAMADRSAHELAWHPADRGWSAGEVLEHLVVANDSYLRLIVRLVERDAPRRTASTTWRPSLMGRFLAGSLRAPRKLPAPKVYRPSAPRAGVLEALHAQHAELQRLIAAADPLEWRRIRLSSPVSALIRLNLGDAFVISVVHTERHLGQLERVLERARASSVRM